MYWDTVCELTKEKKDMEIKAGRKMRMEDFLDAKLGFKKKGGGNFDMWF